MEEILKLVSEFIKEKQSKKEWVAGKDLVQYAGDYFNEDEYVAAVKTNVASGSIRAQGRLNGKVSSPYSLDKTKDFTKLFGALSKKDLQKYK